MEKFKLSELYFCSIIYRTFSRGFEIIGSIQSQLYSQVSFCIDYKFCINFGFITRSEKLFLSFFCLSIFENSKS